MATERQIEANRANAALGRGPRTERGRRRVAGNAVKHHLTGSSVAVEAGRSPEFAARRAKWVDLHRPEGEEALFAIDRAVAASLQIERCERALDELVASTRQRARLAWDLDRRVEAARVFARLADDPVLASRELRASLDGAELMVDTWLGLVAALEAGRDWSEAEASMALDLLGVSPGLRSARTAIDAPEGADPVAFRLELAREEVDHLGALVEAVLIPLDEVARTLATEGDSALQSKAAALILRYERDAWRRHREAMKVVQSQAPPVVAAGPTPPPAVDRRPPVDPPTPTPSEPLRSPPEPRRASPGSPTRKPPADRRAGREFVSEAAEMAELERRLMTMPLATEQTQFVGFAIGRCPR